jgi:hypothetical protein
MRDRLICLLHLPANMRPSMAVGECERDDTEDPGITRHAHEACAFTGPTVVRG